MMLSDAMHEISRAVIQTAAEHPSLSLSPTELSRARDAYFERGGKMMRPALCVLLASSLGGKDAARRALLPALATECFHLFTLVHDDVIDHDTLRRGKPSAHLLAAALSGINEEDKAAEYGTSIAILAGDALFSRAVELLCRAEDLPDNCRILLIRKLTEKTLPDLLCGEALDTKLAYLHALPDEETLATVYRNKTGVLFEFALFAGAVCALQQAPDEALCSAIRSAAALLGEAFQLTDDYLGLVSDEQTLGKNTLSDIREGKKTYLLHYFYQSANSEEKALLEQTLGRKDAAEEDLLRARNLLLTHVEAPYLMRIKNAKQSAEALLDLLPDGTEKDLLDALFERMIHREK